MYVCMYIRIIIFFIETIFFYVICLRKFYVIKIFFFSLYLSLSLKKYGGNFLLESAHNQNISAKKINAKLIHTYSLHCK